jgi:Skp family chaperone for outer membrane proteins
MKTTSLLAGFLFLAAPSMALEIPLERGGGGKKGAVVAFVDMERVYKDFPETRKAKQEYKVQLDKIKQELANKDAELDDLRQQLEVLKAARSSDISTGTATSPASMPDSGVSQKESQLQELESGIEQARAEAADALGVFEKKRAEQIFGKLYKSLVQLADEKGVDIVVDKASLLYGQAALDLTDLLSRRVRGLPETDQ